MMHSNNVSFEDSLSVALRPLARSMNATFAREIAKLRIDRQFTNRLEVLAEKNTEGELSAEELNEYDQHLAVLSFISTLQSHARRKLRARKTVK